MGPQLILDKSSLHALSYEEILFMCKHYFVIVTPILIIEVLGDIKKYPNDAEKSVRKVCELSEKVSSYGPFITGDCRTLLAGNLLGREVPMDRKPFRVDGFPFTVKTGERGMYLKEPAEMSALRRWINREFTEAEAILAESWRKSTKSIDLEGWKRSHRDYPRVKNWEELNSYVVHLCDDQSTQQENISFLIDEMSLGDDVRRDAFNRWLERGMPILKEFAPYGHYCLKALHAFYLGISSGLIGTKSTNRVDLEYVFYLPFCKIFSSSDQFLISFAKYFLKENQDFIDGVSLKADLDNIIAHWSSISEQERVEYRRENGNYPPNISDSFTNRSWQKYMGPRAYYKSPVITPERQQKIMERLEPMIEAIEKIDKPSK